MVILAGYRPEECVLFKSSLVHIFYIRSFTPFPPLAFLPSSLHFATAFQRDLRLAVLSPSFIRSIILVSVALAVIGVFSMSCPSFFVICPRHALAAFIPWLGFIALPTLCNVGELPALYPFGGYFQLANSTNEQIFCWTIVDFANLKLFRKCRRKSTVAIATAPFHTLFSWNSTSTLSS